MTVNFTTFFTKAGKAFYAGNTINTAMGTTIHDEVEDFVQTFGTLDIEISSAVDGVYEALQSFKDTAAGLNSTVISTALEKYLVQVVKDDNPQIDDYVTTALQEFIRQMEVAVDSVDASTVGITPSYDAGNTGNGVVVISLRRGDGRINELMLAEDITCVATDATSFDLAGEEAVSDPLSYEWPGGSGVATSLASMSGGNSSYVANGTFEDDDDNNADFPASWIISVGTLSTTINLTPVEVQTVVISGTPTAGWYTLSFTDASSKVQTTAPLAYNATATEVQSALQLLTGLSAVEVTSTGTSPDYTHSITFYEVTNPAQLTSTSALTGGTPAIAHATSTAGSAYVKQGARSLELDSNGVELTTLQQAVVLQPATNYAVCLFACVDVVPAAGVITVDLVDGIGGTVINDEQGTANSFTFNASGLTASFAAQTGVFRTPETLPNNVYFRIRISTAVSAGTSVYLDDVQLTDMTQLYTGGPYVAIFSGTTAWAAEDRIALPVTNDQAGALHLWMDRVFNLRENDLLLPSDSAGSETIADALIA